MPRLLAIHEYKDHEYKEIEHIISGMSVFDDAHYPVI